MKSLGEERIEERRSRTRSGRPEGTFMNVDHFVLYVQKSFFCTFTNGDNIVSTVYKLITVQINFQEENRLRECHPGV